MSDPNESSGTEKLQQQRAERLRDHIARLKAGEEPENPDKPQSLREQIDKRAAENRREEEEKGS